MGKPGQAEVLEIRNERASAVVVKFSGGYAAISGT